MEKNVCIISAKRTPIGAFGGCFNDVSAIVLGAASLEKAVQSINLGEKIEKKQHFFAFFGCVLQAGLGQNPCKQVVSKVFSVDVNCSSITINHVCGSGMTAITQAYDAIRLKKTQFAIAGGMDNMSRAPYLLEDVRFECKKEQGIVIDSMQFDGLEDAYNNLPMINLAEGTAKAQNINRAEIEAYVFNSFKNAQKAIKNGWFKEEIAEVFVKKQISEDEVFYKVIPEKFQKLKPVVSEGILTAATSSAIADGAASVILMEENAALKAGITPLARIIGYANSSVNPRDFTIAPVLAIERLCQEIGWNVNDAELFEINEAFATVPLFVAKNLKIPLKKINVSGGACVLGHPLGCSGARIIVTLIHNMRRLGAKKGIATICIGGGEGIAIAVEIH
ncbi:MAG: thiolase family protein [Holosporales bacterium]|jgi:acetyl-CoA C-acetyltransferase|nr:thiolase family protein [Holosporales bacterium]